MSISVSSPRPRRRSIRLQGFDYGQPGYYFITVTTHHMKCIFGHVAHEMCVLNQYGSIVRECWLQVPSIHPYVELDDFIVMPNHLHAILVLTTECNDRFHDGNRQRAGLDLNPMAHTVGSIIRGFKAGVTSRMFTAGYSGKVWHRNYWEHVIRDEEPLQEIRSYIQNNPLKWETDRLHSNELIRGGRM